MTMDRDMDHYREDEPMTKLEELKASADAASDAAFYRTRFMEACNV